MCKQILQFTSKYESNKMNLDGRCETFDHLDSTQNDSFSFLIKKLLNSHFLKRLPQMSFY